MIIRSLREDRGWSQEQLAEVSGVSVRTIQRIETGQSGSLETLKCLAAVFETTIPEIRKDAEMTKDVDPIEMNEPVEKAPAPDSAGLSEEDRAALRYAHNLRRYDTYYDDKNGRGEDGGSESRQGVPDIPDDHRAVLKQVKRERKFYQSLMMYAAILAVSLVINLLFSPGYYWVVWAAFGFGIATVFEAIAVFGHNRGSIGREWEHREVEKRLNRLSKN